MTVADSCSDSTPRFDSLGIINGAIEDGFEIGKIGGEKLDLFFEKKKRKKGLEVYTTIDESKINGG